MVISQKKKKTTTKTAGGFFSVFSCFLPILCEERTNIQKNDEKMWININSNHFTWALLKSFANKLLVFAYSCESGWFSIKTEEGCFAVFFFYNQPKKYGGYIDVGLSFVTQRLTISPYLRLNMGKNYLEKSELSTKMWNNLQNLPNLVAIF